MARVGVARWLVLSSVGIMGTKSNCPRGPGVLAWSCQVGPFSLRGRALPWAPWRPAVATLLTLPWLAGCHATAVRGSLTPYVE